MLAARPGLRPVNTRAKESSTEGMQAHPQWRKSHTTDTVIDPTAAAKRGTVSGVYLNVGLQDQQDDRQHLACLVCKVAADAAGWGGWNCIAKLSLSCWAHPKSFCTMLANWHEHVLLLAELALLHIVSSACKILGPSSSPIIHKPSALMPAGCKQAPPPCPTNNRPMCPPCPLQVPTCA